jgi:TRAP-type transport system periplasmic protein
LPLIAETPFNVPSAIGGSVALWRTQNKFFNKANEYKGMKLLAQWVNAGYHIQSRKKPITSVGDLAGFKIRSASGPLRHALSNLGAVAVTIPVPKSFELISQGTVDGMLNSGSIVAAFKYARYIKHVTEFPGKLGANSFSYIMNKKTWDGLPAEDKKAIESVSGEHMIRRLGAAYDRSERYGGILIKKAKGKIQRADAAFVKAVRAKTRFIEDDWVKKASARGIAAQAALDYFRKTGKEVTAKARANAKKNKGKKWKK